MLDDHQARVFDRFCGAKGDGGGRDRHAGLGLGLAIVRQVVESHAGQVKLFSRARSGGGLQFRPVVHHSWCRTHERTNGGPPEEQPAV
ncbi:ATP-binding protein [Streptomyces sp. NPDC058470]|uniref:ATP-binding protein n=1 Tax=Streptomyces sp. NPDC058470 TaxID=3346515 RepID=UPI003667DD68